MVRVAEDETLEDGLSVLVLVLLLLVKVTEVVGEAVLDAVLLKLSA